jgi:WD40 repeat protein
MANSDVSTSELIARREWDGLADRLLSFAYVQRTADSGQIFELIAEFDAAASAIPPTHPAFSILPVVAAALRRNADFIARHPAATFQAFWNLCWWHDCPDRNDFAGATADEPESGPNRTPEAGRVSRLMESWAADRVKGGTGSPWLRSLLPPATSASDRRLRLEIPIDTHEERPAALRVSKEHLVAWFRQKRNRMVPRVWSRQTGEPIQVIDRAQFPFSDPSLSADKKLRAGYGGDGGGWGHPVTVSDRKTGDQLAAFPVDEDHNIQKGAFSPDGMFLAAGGYGIESEGYVYVWNLVTGSLHMLVQLQSGVYSVAFSPGSDQVLAGCSDGVVEVCPLANPESRRSIPAHDAGVICAAFAPDETSIASLSYDGTLRLWDIGGGPEGYRFAPHPDSLVEAKFSPCGDRLVTRSSNGTTWLWDGLTGKPVRRLYESSMIVQMGGDSRSCLFVGNHMIVSVAQGGGVWTSSEGDRLADVAERVFLEQSMSFSRDGKRFALWENGRDDNEEITIHDIRTGDFSDPAAPMDVPADEEDGEDGHFELTVMDDGQFRTRKIRERAALARIHSHAGGVTCCAFSADHTLLVSGGADDMVRVWDWETGTEIFSTALIKRRKGKVRRHPDSFFRYREPAIREVKFVNEHTVAAALAEQIVIVDFRSAGVNTVSWSGTLDEYLRQAPYLAKVRGDQVCIVDAGSGEELAWFHCGRALGSSLRVVAHPNGRAWAGMLGERLFFFALERH